MLAAVASATARRVSESLLLRGVRRSVLLLPPLLIAAHRLLYLLFTRRLWPREQLGLAMAIVQVGLGVGGAQGERCVCQCAREGASHDMPGKQRKLRTCPQQDIDHLLSLTSPAKQYVAMTMSMALSWRESEFALARARAQRTSITQHVISVDTGRAL